MAIVGYTLHHHLQLQNQPIRPIHPFQQIARGLEEIWVNARKTGNAVVRLSVMIIFISVNAHLAILSAGINQRQHGQHHHQLLQKIDYVEWRLLRPVIPVITLIQISQNGIPTLAQEHLMLSNVGTVERSERAKFKFRSPIIRKIGLGLGKASFRTRKIG